MTGGSPVNDHSHNDHSHHDHSRSHSRLEDHSHDHKEAGRGGATGENRPRGGPVVLDIGGTIGALIVQLGPAALGTELHVRRPGTSGSTIHTGVWPRRIGTDDVIVAVFPELESGPWAILTADGQEAAFVAVTGGEVTTVELTMAATVP